MLNDSVHLVNLSPLPAFMRLFLVWPSECGLYGDGEYASNFLSPSSGIGAVPRRSVLASAVACAILDSNKKPTHFARSFERERARARSYYIISSVQRCTLRALLLLRLGFFFFFFFFRSFVEYLHSFLRSGHFEWIILFICRCWGIYTYIYSWTTAYAAKWNVVNRSLNK